MQLQLNGLPDQRENVRNLAESNIWPSVPQKLMFFGSSILHWEHDLGIITAINVIL